MGQKQVIVKLLDVSEVNDIKAVGSYLEPSFLTSSDHQKMLSNENKTIHQSLVGRLIYLATGAVSDLCLAASMICSHVIVPTQAHTKIT